MFSLLCFVDLLVSAPVEVGEVKDMLGGALDAPGRNGVVKEGDKYIAGCEMAYIQGTILRDGCAKKESSCFYMHLELAESLV